MSTILCALNGFDIVVLLSASKLHPIFMAINLVWVGVHILGAVGVSRRDLAIIRFHAIAYIIYTTVTVAKLAIPLVEKNDYTTNLVVLGALVATIHLCFAIVVWCHYQVEHFKVASAISVNVAHFDIESGAAAQPKAPAAPK
ncbi:hypothetical protein HDU96_003887 [Phlyctochytrium bullatum]|nr:hypothetical protein HDU96_003887 [Phlyctochytrium bullatum]